MSILRDEISELFGSVFGEVYDDGFLTVSTLTKGAGGIMVRSTNNVTVKVQQDSCTESQRNEDGYTGRDVRLLVLRLSLSVDQFNADNFISVYGKTWSIESLSNDPAASYFDIRAREKK